MGSRMGSWRDVTVEVPTESTLPVPAYPTLARQWIAKAASERNIVATELGRWPTCRTPDYASDMGEYVALLQIDKELVVLSLSNFNALQCNVPTRILRARAPENDDLREIFGYVSAS